MLVLTRKMDEQILIGEDIKITLVRVRGNSVRIGIEAPKHVRVVRGELTEEAATAEDHSALNQSLDTIRAATTKSADIDTHVSQESRNSTKLPVSIHGPSAASQVECVSSAHVSRQRNTTQVFVGSIRRNGQNPFITPAPLARFMPVQ